MHHIFDISKDTVNMATFGVEKDLPSAVHDPEGNGSEKSDAAVVLKLDKNGLPLVPQPSDHIDDPLVCDSRMRIGVKHLDSNIDHLI